MIGSNAKHRGFSLLIALVLSTVAAAITISLTTLAYKSLLLSSAARDSQYAFYAADTAAECALYWDNGARNAFAFAPSNGSVPITCGGSSITLDRTYDVLNHRDKFVASSGNGWAFTVNGTACARITVYKYDPLTAPTYSTQVYADGTNVACSAVSSNPRAVERGLKATY